MIGYLKGNVVYLSSSMCIILAGNVGYEVFLPLRSLEKIHREDEIEVYTYTHVREDQLKLFGFETILEREMFETIIGVSGIGPKIGLLILSSGTVAKISAAISKADVNFFTQIKGLGKKNAQKIIVELKNKIGSVAELDLAEEEGDYSSDVVDALESFGFKKKDIYPVLKIIDKNLTESEQIKIALRELGKG